ncbi:MAG: response regulator transcription factor [Methylocella sp.]
MSEPLQERNIVLVVDDSPDTLSLLTDALEQAGATVLVAVSGEIALDLVRRITPDIILMDAIMPKMDGFETCRRLKSNNAVSHIPVIFMTGLSETEHIVQGLDAGGVDYVTKPIAPDELLARIRVHLANARASQSARMALDATGRFLLAANAAGRVLWCTPQATKLLEAALPSRDGSFVFPETLRARLKSVSERSAESGPFSLPSSTGQKLQLSFLGQIGDDELLFRLTNEQATTDQLAVLKQQFGLTPRESEVLLWVAQGKANRDIGEILSLSPRTVNKHLEQIFTKLGVENRATAAAIAVRALSS